MVMDDERRGKDGKLSGPSESPGPAQKLILQISRNAQPPASRPKFPILSLNSNRRGRSCRLQSEHSRRRLGGARVQKSEIPQFLTRFRFHAIFLGAGQRRRDAVVDPGHLRLLIAPGGMDCSNSKRCAVAMASLPDEPLVEILSRVPVKSLCRFKCVSRAWLILIADPLHRRKLPQTLEGFLFDSCGDDSDSDVGDGEDSGSDAVHDCDSDEDSGSDGGDGDNSPRRVYGYFVDVSGRSVRPVGPCFPFLAELRVPGIENIRLLHHCNGLLLFGYIQESDKSLSYIVSNPATEQWVAVPSSGGKRSSLNDWMFTSLVFDPAASSAFHLVQIEDEAIIPVHVYSSKSGVWNHV